MLYECIVCNCRWAYNPNYNPNEISSGICLPCFRTRMKDKIHKEQLKHSGIPCFMTAEEACDQCDCKYEFACLENKLKEWKRFIIKNGEIKTNI